MNKTSLKAKLIPLIAILLFCLLYHLGYFQMILIAVLVIIASAIEYKKELFKSLGFQRKNLRLKSLLITAPLVGIAIFLIYSYLLVPGVTALTGQPVDYSEFAKYKGDLPAILTFLAFVWVTAGFGEEIVFRGYLMRQFTKFFGSSTVSIVINILLFGFIFGWIHAYQGISGQIVAGITGMTLAIIFHIRKSDLWFNVAVHGFVDTIALVYMYYGWI